MSRFIITFYPLCALFNDGLAVSYNRGGDRPELKIFEQFFCDQWIIEKRLIGRETVELNRRYISELKPAMRTTDFFVSLEKNVKRPID